MTAQYIYIHVESPLVCIPIAGARLMRIEARIVLLGLLSNLCRIA